MKTEWLICHKMELWAKTRAHRCPSLTPGLVNAGYAGGFRPKLNVVPDTNVYATVKQQLAK